MKTKTAALSNGNFRIYRSESNAKPTLLCIHGGMGLASDSLMTLEGLSDEFDLIFMDQRGHGRSAAAADGNYWFENFSNDIRELVQKLDLKKPLGIFGHSMGGMIAIQVLSDFPGIFQFAILSNTALNSAWQIEALSSLKILNQNRLEKNTRAYEDSPGHESLKNLAVVYGPVYFPELSQMKAESEMSKFTYRNDSLRFMNENVYGTMNLSEKAKSIKIPVLVLSGELDKVVPVKCQVELAGNIRNSTHAIIEKAGHFPFITQTKNFEKFVSNFWDKIGNTK